MPGSDLDLLIDAARASGDIARKHFQSDPQVWDKDGGAGPVTEADLEIDTMLRTELLAARATYGWLSEETEDDAARLDHERVFIVDPIDGTRAFIEGKHHFSHSLAIAENGVVTTAVVYLPMMDKLYAATDQTAATMNGEAIAPSTRAELDGATLLATKNNLKDEHWQGGTPPFEHRFRPSLAYRLCLVAEGRFDAMLTLRDCWEWDIAAGELIVRQAGGQATTRQGAALPFNAPHPKTKGCLAAGGALHGALLARLKD